MQSYLMVILMVNIRSAEDREAAIQAALMSAFVFLHHDHAEHQVLANFLLVRNTFEYLNTDHDRVLDPRVQMFLLCFLDRAKLPFLYSGINCLAVATGT